MNPWREEFIEIVRSDLRRNQSKNRRFSMRAYAKKMGLGISTLSEMLHSTKGWQISADRAESIVRKIELKPSRRNRLLVKMEKAPKHQEVELAPSEYEFISDPKYFAILFSFDLPEPLRSPAKIAERLGLPIESVSGMITKLLARGLLAKRADGQIFRPEIFLKASDGTPSEMGRKHHESGLDLARSALELPVEERDFTSLTFAGNHRQIAQLRAEIRNLHKKASSLLDEDSANDTVFRLSVQLFPVRFHHE